VTRTLPSSGPPDPPGRASAPAAPPDEADDVLDIDWGAQDDEVDEGDEASAGLPEAQDADADADDPTERDSVLLPEARLADLPAAAPAPGTSAGSAGAPAPAGTGAPSDDQAEPRWSARDRTRERELLRLVADLPEDDPRRVAARDEIVTMHLPLASFLARRFRDRGESMDDLTQVATIGLLKAVDRFEPERGVEFSTFATPTVVGEIKRHFRDKGWAIRVPRRLQELRISISRATAELSQTTGRSPTVAELAAHIGVTEDDILEGLESAQAYSTLSLDTPATDAPDEGGSLVESLGEEDPGLGEVETRETLTPLLATLAPRERRIIHMRFYENMTQSQIAEQIGVSQMHVSRLLAKSLAQMRTTLTEPED
jgi:RNA polymerase sigma-B factor